MKVVYFSDIHLERNGVPKEVQGLEGDILIMAGDITTIPLLYHPVHGDVQTKLLQKLNEKVLKNFTKVFWIPGNHEYYFGDLEEEIRFLKELLVKMDIDNVIVANDDHITFGTTCFIFSTLWTDMNKRNPLDMMKVQYGLNDYMHIKCFGRPLTPEDTVMRHDFSLRRIKGTCNYYKNDHNIIVVTHHAPSLKSDAVPYKTELSPGFVSDLDDFILDSGVHTWIHGHTHHNVDYMIGDTRIVSAQYGYKQYGEHKGFKPGILEL